MVAVDAPVCLTNQSSFKQLSDIAIILLHAHAAKLLALEQIDCSVWTY